MQENSKYHELKVRIQALEDELKEEKIRNSELINVLRSKQNQLEGSAKEISDSINYAQRIQKAIMPPVYYVHDLLPNSFVYYRPKDVVSGDFYFVEKVNNKVIFSAVDCTGHGVPGALISVVGFNYLDQAVRERGMSVPGEILSYLDEGVNDKLRQTANESGVYDSMDLGLCAIDFEKRTVEYAGAFNPLYYHSKDELHEIKADKFPIGMNEDGVVDVYTNHKIQLDKGDTVYLFSDGYADQFGGAKGKKFKYGPFKQLMLDIQHLEMDDQCAKLDQVYRDWKGNFSQVDDILIIGVKV